MDFYSFPTMEHVCGVCESVVELRSDPKITVVALYWCPTCKEYRTHKQVMSQIKAE